MRYSANVQHLGFPGGQMFASKSRQFKIATTRKPMQKRFCLLAIPLILAIISPLAPAQQTPREPLPVATFQNLQASKPQTVVVYGTSLTVKGTWVTALNEYFEKQHPGEVNFVKAAKSGMDSNWGVANFKERVLSQNPDLVFIEFSANDAATPRGISIEKSLANLDTMIQELHGQNPKAEVVLQTMNPAWDSPRMQKKKYGSERPNLAAYYDAYRHYANEHGLPLVDNYTNWQKILQEEPERFQKMVPDGIHPSSTSSLAVTWPAVEALLEKAHLAVETGGKVTP